MLLMNSYIVRPRFPVPSVYLTSSSSRQLSLLKHMDDFSWFTILGKFSVPNATSFDLLHMPNSARTFRALKKLLVLGIYYPHQIKGPFWLTTKPNSPANSPDEGPWVETSRSILSVLGSCHTTLDSKLFEGAAMLLPGYIGTLLRLQLYTAD